VVFQQVDFVDVEKAAVRACQQAGLEGLHACAQRTFEVECADHAVFGGAERQVDHRHRHGMALERGLALARLAFRAARGKRGVAQVTATDHRAHGRQQGGQRTHGGGLAGAPVTEHQHTADARVDGRDQDRELHFVLTDDG